MIITKHATFANIRGGFRTLRALSSSLFSITCHDAVLGNADFCLLNSYEGGWVHWRLVIYSGLTGVLDLCASSADYDILVYTLVSTPLVIQYCP